MVPWLLDGGDCSKIVLSSRVRIARNLKVIPFVNRAGEGELSQVLEKVINASRYAPSLKDAIFFDVSSLSDLDCQLLVERHLISPNFALTEHTRGLIVCEDESISIMINEEDHLRIQVIRSGLQAESAWDEAYRAERELSSYLEYSSSEELGYLTACITNVGTGLRVSVLIHLPGLALTRDIESVLRGLGQLNLAVRGFYGEGTEVAGNLFQISNQVTLGQSEEEITAEIDMIIRHIVRYEEYAREKLLDDAKSQIEDKVWRSYGILENARMLTAQEFMNLFSAVRLGCDMGIIPDIDPKAFNELIVLKQPSHLQKLAGRELSADERDILRARTVREKIAQAKSRC